MRGRGSRQVGPRLDAVADWSLSKPSLPSLASLADNTRSTTMPMTTTAPSESADFEFRTRRRPCRCRQALPVPGRSPSPSFSLSPSLPLRLLTRFHPPDRQRPGLDAAAPTLWTTFRPFPFRVPMPAPGRHDKITPEEAANTIRSMAGHWSDTDIAAALNRMRVTTAHGHTWTAERVRRYRWEYRLPSLKTRTGGDEVLTLAEAADRLRVSRHVVRKLIRLGVIPARQAVAKAPWRIRAVDLQDESVAAAVAKAGNGPASGASQRELPMFSIDSEGDSQ